MLDFVRDGLSILLLAITCSYLIWHYEIILSAAHWILYILWLPLTLTLTLRFDVIHVILLLALLSVSLHVLLYHYVWKRYSHLAPVATERAPPFELHPVEAETVAGAERFSDDYLGTFLSSIKIFGYLEKNVLQEISRDLQEMTLRQGQTLKVSGRDFYVVVAGRIQIVMPFGRPRSLLTVAFESLEESEDPDQSTVLTEVCPGGTVSSLFDVLSIFTGTVPAQGPKVSPIAMEDSRLMIIPEQTFVKLTEKYPKAAAHIVQVIMTRFQRVTFLTLQKYFGLTKEAMRIEQSLNDHGQADNKFLPTLDVIFSLPVPDDPDLAQDRSIPARGNQRISEMMTQLSRDSRDAIQQHILTYFASTFHIDLPISQSSGTGNSALWENISLRVAQPDTHLVSQGDRNPGLFILIHGRLLVSSHPNESIAVSPTNVRERTLFEVTRPGSLVGSMAAFMGQNSMVTITAKEECLVAFMNKRQLEWIVDRHPKLLISLAGRLLKRLSPLVRLIDLALDWLHLNAGQIMCRQEEVANHVFIVMHGRVRCIRDAQKSTTTTSSPFEIIGEYGAGESIGESEMLLSTCWPGTFHAIRDSEIACMPKILFNALSLMHPEITLNVSRILAHKNRPAALESPLRARPSNLCTVAILPVHTSYHRLAVDFAYRLRDEIFTMGSTLLLDSATMVDVLGRHAFSAFGKLKLLEWLNQTEEEHRVVIYLADSVVQSRWTQRCIRQADCILLVAYAEGDPSVGAYERLLLGSKSSARRELVLLHRHMNCPSGLTRTWLNNRVWIMDHHHVYLPSLGQGHAKDTNDGSNPAKIWQIVVEQLEKYGIADTGALSFIDRNLLSSRSTSTASASSDDFRRLARRLLGRTVGLVLGGGGARGLAHLGVVKAMVEAGIPIDAVGGTSIGALMSALYARDVNYYSAQAFAKSFSQRISSKWRQLFDLTYPITSWLTGHAFNRGLWKIFGDLQIEDLWLPFFCVTTDIAHSKMVVHRSGYIWRYVRASMSLSGILPPMCDNGALLIDGGYFNNVPVDVMMVPETSTSSGATIVVAIDVGSADETQITDYGDTLSGVWLLLQRMFGRKLLIPTLTEIQSRLTYVSCTEKLEQLKEAAQDGSDIFYLRPPVAQYGIMDFGRFSEIYQAGYRYGLAAVDKWRQDGTLRRLQGYRENNNGGMQLYQRDSPTTLVAWGTDADAAAAAGDELSSARVTPEHSARGHSRRQSM